MPVLLRSCGPDDFGRILEIINSAAEAYRGEIPADCCHEPYMAESELAAEIAAGVSFMGCDVDGKLSGVMGVQPVRNVDLIRHAYVLPADQGKGIGTALLRQLMGARTRQVLVGTWAAARWAIAFYERHGFAPVPAAAIADTLRAYWTISSRQIETSVVLANPVLDEAGVAALLAGR